MTRIITVIVDEQNLTMYKEDGTTIIVAQGDPRIRGIVEKAVPAVEMFGFYELTDEDLVPTNTKHFAETEEATSGVVKFFRLAKKKLAEIAAKFREPIAPMQVGTLPVADQSPLSELVPDVELETDTPAIPSDVREELKQDLTRGQLAVAEIMASAASTSSPAFHKADVKGEEETVVVAVVDGETVIPDVDKIEPQLKAIAAKLGTSLGVTNFFRRLAKVQRNHSVVDLLKFMEKGELPIADDGTILVYKRLNALGQGDTRHFTDVHSGQVKQKVGSHVFMAEKLVDPNRNNDCSNGLHIARRDYLTAFSGNVVVLCKLAPEDVISVPIYDARKLRCKGYTIVAELNEEDARSVTRNQPMKDTVLLGNVAAGNHTAVLETVEITKSQGGGLIVTPTGANKQAVVVNDEKVTAESLDKLPEADAAQAKVNARDVAMGKITAPPPSPKAVIEEDVITGDDRLVAAVVPNSTKRPIDILVNNFNLTHGLSEARALLDFKKSAKKSWTALGVDIKVWEEATQIVAHADVTTLPPAASAMVKDVDAMQDTTLPAAKRNEAAEKVMEKLTPPKAKTFKASAPAVQNIPKKPKVAKVNPVANAQPAVKKTQAEHVAGLVEVFERVPCKSNAMAIVNYKRSSKKSWDTLGVKEAMVKRLKTYDK